MIKLIRPFFYSHRKVEVSPRVPEQALQRMVEGFDIGGKLVDWYLDYRAISAVDD
jgi:hypothetical protein